MITVTVKPQRRRRWRDLFRRRQTVLAVFSYRYDAHLVPDLLANIDPIVDVWVALDDRASTGIVSSEFERQRTLIRAARTAGADWILAMDPDERFEAGRCGRHSQAAAPAQADGLGLQPARTLRAGCLSRRRDLGPEGSLPPLPHL